MPTTDLKNKYKDRKPEETIKHIKDFFENKGFELKIEHQKSFENIYSCLVYLYYNGEKLIGHLEKAQQKNLQKPVVLLK